MSGPFTGAIAASNLEIERLLYIKDDGRIASYLGIDRERVAKVRAAAPKGAQSICSTASPIGFDATAETYVRMSSEALLGACNRLFEREARRVKCPVDFARDYLLDGHQAAISRFMKKEPHQ